MSDQNLIILALVLVAAAIVGWLLLRRPSKPQPDPWKERIDQSDVAVMPDAVPVPPLHAGPVTAIGIPAAEGPPDDLRRMKGIGPKLGAMLTSLEITRYDQIAAWGPAEIAAVDAQLGSFKGRIARDNWVEQAALLADGRIAEFEGKFGKLDPSAA